MESTNQKPGVDTLTLQLRESIKYELLKKDYDRLKKENIRLRQLLKIAEPSEQVGHYWQAT